MRVALTGRFRGLLSNELRAVAGLIFDLGWRKPIEAIAETCDRDV